MSPNAEAPGLLGSDAASSLTLVEACTHLREGRVVAIPTETVYGLAADACNEAAVAEIYRLKGRPQDHPLIVHVADLAQAHYFAREISDFAWELMQRFWPGPLTVIVPRHEGRARAAAGGQDSIGLRCPAHPLTQDLLRACAQAGVAGLAAPSANRFGRVSPTTAAHVRHEFGPDLPVLDGGPCNVGIESTIVDCTRGRPVLLRPGHISRAVLSERATAPASPTSPTSDLAAHAAPAPRASGTLAAHYAPRARVRLFEHAQDLDSALALAMGSTPTMTIALWSPAPPGFASGAALPVHWHWQAQPQDAAAAQQQLFALLRDFDALGAREIWVQMPPERPEWEGVRDRLQRAAAAS